MLKGKTKIELTNVHTGQKEIYEDSNMVTEAISDIFNTNILGMLYNSTSFNSSSGDSWMLPIMKNLMGGILLYQNELEEREDNIYAPLSNPLIGYAADDANNTTDIRRGSRNLTESKEIDGGFRFVWDFATSQGNGTISAIALTNTLAGKGLQSSTNYMVCVSSHLTNINSIYKTYLERSNKRLYIEDGYRLEMTTYYNSTQAVLRKMKHEYLHARLVIRPLAEYSLEAEEEVTIELGHYPYYRYYIGGSKDGTVECDSSYTDIKDYFFHGADGKWYGISRRASYKYSYTSGDTDYYNRVGYEWYIDTIDADQCTSKKITTPSGISEFESIGMSGKWLMCRTGSTVYRVDTTNIANIELVSDITYSSSDCWTYVVDDDIVINGWYFQDGEPKLYIRDTTSADYVFWGRGQMARYKTYTLREFMRRENYNNSDHQLCHELYLFTPYLATINNLGTPVIKTADKTMKITYTITEE